MNNRSRAVYGAPAILRRLVSRRRLVDLIETGSQHPLTIVRGAAGTGKSALLGEWAHSRSDSSGPAVWVTMDGSNSGRVSFWSSVVETVVSAGFAAPGSLLADIDLAAEQKDAVRSTLFRGLRQLPSPVLLVIDDFHLVHDETVAADLLWLLDHSDRLRVLVATRAISELESATAMARFAPTVITGNDLTFSLDDTRDAVARAGLTLAADEISALHEHVEGWPLGVRLLLVEFENRSGTAQRVNAATAAHAVIARTSSRLIASFEGSGHLEFLLHTSIAERLTADLLNVLTPDHETNGDLEWMEREGLGGWDEAGWIRIHPLLRAALESEFELRQPAQARELRRRLARWANATGDVPTSIRQSVLTQDWDHLSTVVKRHFGPTVRLYPDELEAALNSVPGPVLRRSPVLITALALQLNARPSTTGQRLRTLATVALSLTRDRLSHDRSPERVWLLVCSMAIERISGRHDQAARTADKIIDYLPDFIVDPAEGLERTLSTVQLQVATSLFYVGRHREAAGLLREVVPVSAPWGAIHALSLDVLILAMRGDMTATTEALETLRLRQSPTGWRGTYSATGYHLAEAMACLERFDLDGARREVAALDRHRDTIEHWPLLLRMDGLIALAAGDAFGGAQRIAAEVAHRKISSTSSAMSALVASTRADLLIAAGQTERARKMLHASGLTQREVGLTLARAALAENRSDRVIELVEPYIWDEGDMPRAQAEALLLRAVALARLGRANDARESLERALEVLEHADLRRPLMMVPRAELRALLESFGEWRGLPAEALLDGVPDAFGGVVAITRLSARESEVLGALVTTPHAAEIAAILFVSPNTVKSQLRSVYRKLGVSSRDDALRVATERGLVRGDA